MAEPVESEPLDKNAATKAAVLPPLTDTSCLVNPPTADQRLGHGRPDGHLDARRRPPGRGAAAPPATTRRQHVDWVAVRRRSPALAAVGLLAIYSARYQTLTLAGLDPYFYVKRQALALGAGVGRHGRGAARRLPTLAGPRPVVLRRHDPAARGRARSSGRSRNGAVAWFEVGRLPAPAVGVRQGDADPDAGRVPRRPSDQGRGAAVPPVRRRPAHHRRARWRSPWPSPTSARPR